MQSEAERESVLERAKKLLRMAEDAATTANEKLVASSKLAKMMLEYNLAMFEVQAEEESPYITETVTMGNAYKWRHSLMRVLCDFNFCTSLKHNQTKRTIIGRKDNVEWVTWLHKHIRTQIEHMASQYLIEASQGQNELWFERHADQLRNSFCTGCVETIRNRLQQERDSLLSDEEKSRALTVLEDSAVKEHAKKLFPGSRSISAHRMRYWSGAYTKGQQAGHQVSLNKQVQ